ncbi:coronatine-insensitive protein 1-like protein [Tanacetum coccineum]
MDTNDIKQPRLDTETTDTVFSCVIPYFHPNDLNSVSLVSRKLYELDSMTRKHVTINNCYSVPPSRLLSSIIEIDGEWLHELALRNKCIESFNHYLTPFYKYDYADLALLAKNCRESLVSLKIKGCPRKYVAEVFSYAVNLEEFGGDPYIDEGEEDIGVKFPPKMRRVTWRKGNILDITIIRNFGHQLTKLDLRYSRFGSDEHCYLIQKCPNLEELYTNNAIGDV